MAPRLTDSQASHSAADLSRGPCVRDLSPTGLAGPKDGSTMCCWFSRKKTWKSSETLCPLTAPTPLSLLLSPWVPHTQVCATISSHLATLRAPSLILLLLALSPHFSVNKNQNILSFSLFPAQHGCLPASRRHTSCSMAWSSCPYSFPKLASLCPLSNSNNTSAVWLPASPATPVWPDRAP